MTERKATLWLTAAAFCLPSMLSSCSGERGPAAPLGIEPRADTCPLRQSEHQSDVDVRLDNLSTEKLTVLADAGRADAMVLLALRYGPSSSAADPIANPAPDMDKALALLQRAVDKKNADAEYLMGVVYINGLGVPKDEKKAADWFKRGAQHGNAAAQYWFGEVTAKGRGGIAPDWEAALPYFRRAAVQGVTDAFLEIGYMHSNVYGDSEQAIQKAAFCYRQVQTKSPLAQFNLRRLIDDGKIAWEPGDPGAPLEKPPVSTNN